MSDLPAGWAVAEIKDLASIKLGKMLDKTKNKGEPQPYLRNINVRWGEFDLSDILTMRFTDEELPTFEIRDGDLIVCEGGEPGRCAVWNDGPTALKYQKALLRARFADGVHPVLLALYMRLLADNGQLQDHFTGTTIKHLPHAAFEKIRVPLPPQQEQRRIVAKLDSLRARSGRARNELDHIPKLIERYKQAILRAALKGALTADWRTTNKTEPVKSLLKRVPPPEQPRGGREATDSVTPGMAGLSVNHPQTDAPEGWQWTPLLRLARQETGHTPSRSHAHYWDGGIPWIGIKDANIHHGRTIVETLQTVSEDGLSNSSARLLPEGTVCLSRTASVGYVTIMGRSMATSQDFATWTCTEALLPKFLMYALMAEGDDIRRFGEGSTHTTIYFPEIRALHICLAPIAEQAEIIRRVEHALAWVDKIATEYARAEYLLPKLDQAILAKAFRGELVPQDPNDEPASVLLERIKERPSDASRRKRRSG